MSANLKSSDHREALAASAAVAAPSRIPRQAHAQTLPQTMTLHRALWAGKIMSAFVVIALVADGTIQLFAPAQIASMLQETEFAMDLTRVVGPIILVLRHPLRHP